MDNPISSPHQNFGIYILLTTFHHYYLYFSNGSSLDYLKKTIQFSSDHASECNKIKVSFISFLDQIASIFRIQGRNVVQKPLTLQRKM